jgi:hypothetical protein
VQNTTFWKHHTTLLEDAKELSILCKILVAMVVYGLGKHQVGVLDTGA